MTIEHGDLSHRRENTWEPKEVDEEIRRQATSFDQETDRLLTEHGTDSPEIPFVTIVNDLTPTNIASIALAIKGTSVKSTDTITGIVGGFESGTSVLGFMNDRLATNPTDKVVSLYLDNETETGPINFPSETAVVRGPQSVSFIYYTGGHIDGDAIFKIATVTPKGTQYATETRSNLVRDRFHGRNFAKALLVDATARRE